MITEKRLTFLRICSVATIAVASFVLVGWIFEIDTLKTVLPGYISMKANTAFALIALSIALLLYERKDPRGWRKAGVVFFASFALLIGLLTQLQYAFDWDFGIDELLFLDPVKPTARFPAGRLAPITAISFIITGLSFLMTLGRKPFFKVAQSLTFVAFLISFQALVGYLCGVTYSFGTSYYTQMALHTSLLFCLVTAGFLSARRDEGLMPMVTSPGVGGSNARKLLASAMIIPPLVNAIQLKAEAWGWIAPDLGVLVRVMGNVVFFFFIVWRTSTVLIQTERERLESEKHRLNLMASEQAARQGSELKTAFLANMSHEIRTPINGIIGMTGLVLDTPLTATQRDYIETIRSSADSLLTIVNDILDLSKVESGKMDLENLDFEPASLFQEVRKTLAYAAESKGLRLTLDLNEELYQMVKGDPGRIRQILLNLVSNAIKFTESGEVSIRSHKQSETGESITLRVEVRDSGIGLTSDVAQKLFQPFVQADQSTSRRYGGTGLGLSICRRLVDLMGGQIGVNSEPDKGSIFWFTLQLKKSEIKATARPNRPAWTGPLLQGRILVAEDNMVNQKIALAMLAKFGHRGEAVANGSEVLETLKQIPYDLILMDCQMPEMDGFEATQQIRSGQHSLLVPKSVPIVAMTANAIAGDREKCLAAGMDDYLSKPVNAALLEQTLQKWLAHAQKDNLS